MPPDRITNEVGEAPTNERHAVADTPTAELVSGAVGGRCANCHAPLTSDQRYCLNCGQRRGKARFPVMPTAASEPAAAVAPRPRHRPRMSGAATVVAGVATLLIALGVGVLIGHDGNTPTPQRASNQIITVSGGGSDRSAGANTTASGSTPAQATKPPAGAKASLKRAKPVVVQLRPKIKQKAASAASRVLGQNGNMSHNVTQQQGASCNGGAGCQNGHFTGNFFPGG
jgi:hypothetical protein